MAASYVEVAVELPVWGRYHYSVPAFVREQVAVGCRVLVPFGHRGVSGVVVARSESVPEGVKVKDIDALVSVHPLLPAPLVDLCMWVATYYDAPPGEVIKAALPVGAQIKGSQMVLLTEEGRRVARGEGGAVPPFIRDALAEMLKAGGKLRQSKLLKGKGRGGVLAQLVSAGYAEIERSFGKSRVKAKTVRVARVVREPSEDEAKSLRRSPARSKLLERLTALGGEADVAELKKTQPTAADHVRALSKLGLVEIKSRVVHGDAWANMSAELGGMSAARHAPTLSPAQTEALAALHEGLSDGSFHSYLLHGITGSGKTEVYLGAVAKAVEAGRGAIVLVPEISLTPQLAARFRARFGAGVAVLHSGLTNRERYDEWHRIRKGEARIALGARSAVFAPVEDLAIVCVDEEHDPSFKQEEGVRYHARDIALVRAQRAGAICVLGSATPSLESFYAAEQGKHRLLSMPERATPRPLPAVEAVDLRRYQPDKDSMLSAPLAEAVESALASGEQTILFLNRRGFETFVVCVACGHAFRCPNCSVSLTYHRRLNSMNCHHCGHTEALATSCPNCNAEESISRRGVGTEKIADAIAERFPEARVARLDRDVGSGREVQRILGSVARGEVDILIGTQMVTKGHDFPGVTTVGVLLADVALSFPDFRASERTFQLLTQVAGRAGRGEKPGRVLIQTYRPDASSIACATRHDYQSFYDAEIEGRKELGYPPSGHLIAIRVSGQNEGAVARSAREIAKRVIHASDTVQVLGPAEAPLARLAGRTRWHLWLRGDSRKDVRHAAWAAVPKNSDISAQVRVIVDVDPISAL